MLSMTGYGKGEATVNGRSLVVELKSVNHRFLDLAIKLPRALIFAEDLIKKTIGKRISRGHIDVFTTYLAPNDSANLSLNKDVAKSYLDMATELSNDFGLKNDYTTSALLRVNGVVEECVVDIPEEEIIALVTEATNKAVDGLVKMRTTEGDAISKDLLNKMDEIERLTNEIEKVAPLVTADYKVKLKARMDEALAGVNYDEARLLTEIAVFSDKCCIDEELARLHTHIAHYRKILSGEEVAGRKLDFLTQELNREANTIGSKANDSRITENVVLLKCEIEKVREQIQNLE